MRIFKSNLITLILLAAVWTACSTEEKSDAYGNFEAVSVTISAEGTGKLIEFSIEEGQELSKNQVIGFIDTTQLHLEKEALIATLRAIDDKLQDASPDVAVLVEQKANATRELNRTRSLYEQKAATKKQLDDMEGQVDLIERQIESTKERIGVANRAILSERAPIEAQIQILEDKIAKNVIRTPIDGTVLTKIMEPSEFVSYGSPLFRIANLEQLKLRAYTSSDLLQKTKLNGKVTVLIDDATDGLRELSGTVTWIANSAEFTPKTIETREDRVNLVYAIDVLVPNDGSLKIGMPGEVVFVQ